MRLGDVLKEGCENRDFAEGVLVWTGGASAGLGFSRPSIENGLLWSWTAPCREAQQTCWTLQN